MTFKKVSQTSLRLPIITKRYSSSSTLVKTPLFDLHVENNATMVPYAGYSMPVLYKGQSHIDSHKWTRTKAGLFDVSHMLQHRFAGPDATALLEKITPSALANDGLKDFHSTLSVLLNEEGGVIDDTIISKHGDNEFYVVTNAGCREKDLAFIKKEINANFPSVKHEIITGGLLALQGPEVAATLQKFTKYDLSQIKFGQSAFIDLPVGNGAQFHAARGGYTGEDGFEISIPDDVASLDFARLLLSENPDVVKPIGLAARDSLRLEAGMCLYGHELSEEITPIEATLTWVVNKARREKGDFNGASKILAQIKDKTLVKRKRVGFTVTGPAARDGCKIFTADKAKEIGYVTSGLPSPSVGANIGMAYVDREFTKSGTKISVLVRGKYREGELKKMPFITPNYYR